MGRPHVHIETVLTKLREAGLMATHPNVDGAASKWKQHLIGAGKMSIPAHRSEALETYTRSTSKKGL